MRLRLAFLAFFLCAVALADSLPRRATIGLRIAEDGGVVVRDVGPGSPSAEAGIEVGDRIVSIDDTAITTARTFLAAAKKLRAGQPATFVIKRGDESLTRNVTPREAPCEAADLPTELHAYEAALVSWLDGVRNGTPIVSESEAVRGAFERLVAAFNARDAAAAISHVAPDAILTYPGLDDATFDAVKARTEKMFANDQVEMEITAKIEEIGVSGDVAFVRATWRATGKTKSDGKTFASGERDLEIWKRQPDGTWKIARGISFPIR